MDPRIAELTKQLAHAEQELAACQHDVIAWALKLGAARNRAQDINTEIVVLTDKIAMCDEQWQELRRRVGTLPP
jgi:chromosome segregation ATPase